MGVNGRKRRKSPAGSVPDPLVCTFAPRLHPKIGKSANVKNAVLRVDLRNLYCTEIYVHMCVHLHRFEITHGVCPAAERVWSCVRDSGASVNVGAIRASGRQILQGRHE